MNFLITMVCPKKCSFCFSKKTKDEMSLEDFKRYADIAIDVLDQSHVGFVGGEPTAHPNLVSMMEYVLYEKNRPVALFTNLLGPEDTIEGITNIL